MMTTSEKHRRKLMDKLGENLFEGRVVKGKYVPGKFELLTLSDYYKYVEMPSD